MIKSGLAPIHAGEFLREILEERGLSQAGFERAIAKQLTAVTGLEPA